MFTTETWIRIVCAMMANAVIFGVGAITVLSIPALAANAKFLIPAVVLTSFVLAPVVAMAIAPRMRVRNWGKQAWHEGDALSG